MSVARGSLVVLQVGCVSQTAIKVNTSGGVLEIEDVTSRNLIVVSEFSLDLVSLPSPEGSGTSAKDNVFWSKAAMKKQEGKIPFHLLVPFQCFFLP